MAYMKRTQNYMAPRGVKEGAGKADGVFSSPSDHTGVDTSPFAMGASPDKTPVSSASLTRGPAAVCCFSVLLGCMVLAAVPVYRI